MLVLKSFLLGLVGFAAYAVLDLSMWLWKIRPRTVGLDLIAKLTFRDRLWWTVGVLMIVLVYIHLTSSAVAIDLREHST
jgi:hypothetical protein